MKDREKLSELKEQVICDFDELYKDSWHVSSLPESIEILAQKSKFIKRHVSVHSGLEKIKAADQKELNVYIQKIADNLGIEAEPVEFTYANFEDCLCNSCPAILSLPDKFEQRFLLLLKGNKDKLIIITPEYELKQISLTKVCETILYDFEGGDASLIKESLISIGVSQDRLSSSQKAILKEKFALKAVSGCWILRLSPAESIWKQVLFAKIPLYSLKIISVGIVIQLLTLLGWWLVGRGAITGELNTIWLYAVGLIMVSIAPLEYIISYSSILMMLRTAEIFKKRLLLGILHLEPEEIKHQGAGQFFGCVMESNVVEQLSAHGGSIAIISNLELVSAMFVLNMGIGGTFHAFVFISWIIISIFFYVRWFKKRNDKIELYRSMSNDLIEQMVGHRTRLVQEDKRCIHDEEDNKLSKYCELANSVDDTTVKINVIIAEAWPIIGLIAIIPSFVMPLESNGLLAVSIGGIVLAFQALRNSVDNMSAIKDFFVFWKQVRPLLQTAVRKKAQHSATIIPSSEFNRNISKNRQPILAVYDVSFRYGEYLRPILKGCNLKIMSGDRFLLEGPSGGGKSTFAMLIAGLKKPISGILLLGGFDQLTIGIDEWRKKVVIAPQFHENHIFMGTLSFNLLMGSNWPPKKSDLIEAENICNELGLGDLIKKMPAGLQQIVGEGGWHLSHGEKSRIYIARALLQKAEIVILDESFGALDPENLFRAISCVLNRVSTILVIAHP
ncbi:MAG: ABC transporter ATP-binding protein [Desulfobacterales bacterium]|nr:ABC transporter ATP-binding protein [Desulfobacterales bacterium]MBF0395437.1 ABC transporter ATP-binding protein [Desulfobacterales bacterium]